MNLFLVTSPFQYICANEARCKYSTKNNILLLVNQESEPGITQQRILLNESDWDHVITIGRKNRSKVVPQAIQAIRKIIKGSGLQHFFHGEYNAWRTKLLLRNLPINKEVYFDDGTLTINEYEEVIRPRAVYHRKRFLQDITIRLRGCKPIGKMCQSPSLEIFTIFHIDNPEHKVVKNELTWLKNKYRVTSLFNPNAPIGFIGQGAIGHKRRKSVNSYIREIKYFQDKFKRDILYFPHRTESKEVRDKLELLDGLSYHDSKLPLEIELVDKNIELSGLVGILSTVQYTALIIYPDMPIYNLKNTVQDNDYTLSEIIQQRENRIASIFKSKGIEDIIIE